MAGPHIASAEIDVSLDAKALSAQAKRIAKNFSDDFGGELDDGINSQMSQLGRDLRKQMEKNGEFAGKGFGEGLRKDATKEAEKFYDELQKAAGNSDFSKVAARFDNIGDAIEAVDKHLVLLNQHEEITERQSTEIGDSFKKWAAGATVARNMEQSFSELRSELTGVEGDLKKMTAEATKAGRANETIFSAKAKKQLQDATRWEKEFGDVGKAAFTDVRSELRAIGDELGDLDQLTTTAQRASAALAKLHKTSGQKSKEAKDVEDWTRAFEGLEPEIERTRVQLDETSKSSQKLQKAFGKFTGSDASFKRISKAVRGLDDDLAKVAKNRARVELEEMFNGVKDGSRSLEEAEAAVKKYETVVTRSSKTSSRNGFSLFSWAKGARNDFVNALGVMGTTVENFVNMLSSGALKGAGKTITALGENLAKMGSEGGGLSKAGGQISKIGGSLEELGAAGGPITAILAIVAGLAALAFAAQTAAGGLSVLTGIATALASVLATAVGGALLSLGPIIGALVAGVGGLAIAFQGLDVDKLTKGANKALTGLGDTIAKMLPSTDKLIALIQRLADAVGSTFGKLLGDSANAIIGWAGAFTTALNGPAMKKNAAVFDKTWPDILTNLLSAFTSVFEGISGVIAAISPGVKGVTGSIADAAQAFSDWANSVGGQKTITDFFDKSIKAAHDLWDIAKNLGSALGSIFSQGNDTGQSFLDKLVDITGEFSDFTKSAKGKKDIAQWFDDAKTAAGKVADVLKTVGQLFDKLDTKQTRKQFDQLVGGIENVISVLSTLYDWGAMVQKALSLSTVIEAFSALESTIVGWATSLGSTVLNAIVTGWGAVTGFFASVGGTIASAWSAGWQAVISVVQTGLATVVGFVQSLPGRVVGALEALVLMFAALPGRILNAIASLINAVPGVFTSVGTAIISVVAGLLNSLVSFFTKLPGRIISALQALGGMLASFFTTAWNRAYSAASTVIGKLISFVGGVPRKMISALQALGGMLASFFTTAWNRAYSAASTVIGTIVRFAGGVAGKIISALGDLAGKLWTFFTKAWGRATEGVTSGIGNVLDAVAGFPGKMVSALGDLSGTLYDDGVDLVQGLLDGIGSLARTIGDWFLNRIPSWIRGPFKKALGIGSPSKEFAEYGRNIVQGLVGGIGGSEGLATGAMDNVADKVLRSGARMISDYNDLTSIRAGIGSGAAVTVNQNQAPAATNPVKRSVVVEAGAIQVTTTVADPAVVARKVLDRLVTRVG